MPPDFILRPMNAQDGEAMADLHRRAILAVPPRFYSRDERQSWAHGIDPRAYARIANSAESFLVAEAQDHALAGFCSFRMRDDGDGEICGLYVSPNHQGNGCGKLLLSIAEHRLGAQSPLGIVIRSSLSAVRFYMVHGYAEGPRGQHKTRGGMEISLRWMRKDLIH